MKSFGRDPLVTSACYLAIDPERFMPLAEFRARVDRLVGQVKASRHAAGVDEVFLPGEIEFRKKAVRERDGIPLAKAVHRELIALGRELGVPVDLWRRPGRGHRQATTPFKKGRDVWTASGG